MVIAEKAILVALTSYTTTVNEW